MGIAAEVVLGVYGLGHGWYFGCRVCSIQAERPSSQPQLMKINLQDMELNAVVFVDMLLLSVQLLLWLLLRLWVLLLL